MWLIEEYDLDITCVTMHAYRHKGEVLLNARQVIPIQEAEEYMTQRREKQEQQSGGTKRRKAAIKALLERNVLSADETVHLDKVELPDNVNEPVGEKFWTAEVTGKTGQSDNFLWHYDGEEYSATGLIKAAFETLTGKPPSSVNGYKYLLHPEFDGRTLSDLRNSGVEVDEKRP